MIKVAICDDSLTDVEKFETILDLNKDIEIDYDVFQCAEELLKFLKNEENLYQIYIFDIEMPGMNGLELASEIRENDKKALFIFLTSHSQYMKAAFEVITFDFISKPITSSEFNRVMEKAVRYLEHRKQNFCFSHRQNKYVLSCDDIIFIEKMGRQAQIHTETSIYRSNMTLSEIWKQLDKNAFSHIHTSVIVNLEYIMEIEQNKLVLKNGTVLYVARSHKQVLKEKHLLYMEKMV